MLHIPASRAPARGGVAATAALHSTPVTTPHPPRVLGLGQTTAIVIGAVIGVGIFFTPSQVARIAGSPDRALLLWGVAGLAAACGGLAFGELGRRFPHAGGQYRVVRETWGPFAGFLYVFCLLTAIQSGAAAIIASVAVRNLGVALGVTVPDAVQTVGALSLIGMVTATNIVGVKQSAGFQVFTVVAKLATLAVIVLLGATLAPAPAPTAPLTPATGLALAGGLLPAFFSYGGWQHALWMAGEVRDPERNVPRAILGGVAVVVLAYVGAAWAYFALLGFDGVVGAKALAAEAVGVVYPGAGPRVVAGMVALSALGVLNAQFLAGPRQVWALARDGLGVSALGALHPTRNTPWVAILALAGCAAAALLLAGTDGIGRLTAWTVVVDSCFFALTALALLRLQAAERRFTAVSLAAVAFVLLEFSAMAGALADEKVRGAALSGLTWIGVAAVLYVLLGRRR